VAVVLLGFTHGQNVQILNYLFGNILTVTSQDFFSIFLLASITLLITFGFWRIFFTIALDEDIAQASGLPVWIFNRLLAILGAATIAISLHIVGILLIGALMVIPVLAAMQWRMGFQKTWILALLISFFSVFLGLIISFYFNLSSSGSIVLCSLVFFLLVTFFPKTQFLNI
jgi:zinc transport system permease protein